MGCETMATISLIRLDDRLIHGQVVTKWIKHTNSNRIIIVDDELVHNAFLINVFKMSAPSGVIVETKSTDEIAKEWIDNKLGSGNILVLAKFVSTLKKAYEKGFTFDNVQVAGLGAGPNKKVVFRTVSLSREDAEILKELNNNNNVNVIFQSIPDEKSVSLDSILNKYFKDL
jgi:mannose/fructose/N-acetylgalactosamine-specific phosphotransferase system component IIB